MRILIIGAGIAGLATYRALLQRGFAAELVEQNQAAGSGGASLFLPGNAVRGLAQLGLQTQLIDKAFPITRQCFLDEKGRLLNAIDIDALWWNVGPCLSLKRAALHELLMNGVHDTDIRHRRAMQIYNAPAGCSVLFDDGNVADYNLVIGADGVHSTVRRALFPDAPPPAYVGNVCWRFIAPNLSNISNWTVTLGRNKSLLGNPVSSSEIYVYADVAADAARVQDYSKETPLLPLFREIAGPLQPVLERAAASEIHFGRIVEVKLERWSDKRVVLVGDAAHASSPSMAEGAGMAIEDALVLADELARSGDIDIALKRYHARRVKRVAWVQRQCAARDRMRRFPSALRNAIIRCAGTKLYRRSYGLLTEPI